MESPRTARRRPDMKHLRIRATVWAFALCALPASAPAQIGEIIEALPADKSFASRVVGGIPGYFVKTPLEQARALRDYAFQTVPLAAVEDFLFHDRVVNLPLEEGLSLMSEEKGGVFCGATAVYLARLYAATGFDAWTYNFGLLDTFTHVTTLVRIDGEIYVQDAYLNFEYMDESDAPVPFHEVILRTAAGNPPPVRGGGGNKPGYFQDAANVLTWSGDDFDVETCEPIEGGLFCHAPITLERIMETYFLADQIWATLESDGWPAIVDYLLLYPVDITSLYQETAEDAAQLNAWLQALISAPGVLTTLPE